MKSLSLPTIRYAARTSLPVMAGYLALGFGFGILLQSKGYTWYWALLMSVTIFAGSMQYVGIDLLAQGASLLTAAIVTLAVNVRHIFYGLSMIEKYKDVGRRKYYLIFGMTDETFSLVCDPTLPDDVVKKDYYLVLTLLHHIYWIVGGVMGAVVGATVAFDSTGIDFVMTALFVVIFVEQWEKTTEHLPASIGVVASVISLLFFGPSNFLISAMILITIALFVVRRRLEGGVDVD